MMDVTLLPPGALKVTVKVILVHLRSHTPEHVSDFLERTEDNHANTKRRRSWHSWLERQSHDQMFMGSNPAPDKDRRPS